MRKPIDRNAISLAFDALAAKGQYDEASEDLKHLSLTEGRAYLEGVRSTSWSIFVQSSRALFREYGVHSTKQKALIDEHYDASTY